MVFTKLSTQEKEAFFGLLDEYFQSRPELFGHNGEVSGEEGISTAAAASAVQRALATAGNVATTSSGVTSKSNNPYAANMQKLNVNETDVSHAISIGRVAAASLAFSGPGSAPNRVPSGSPASDPPTLPRRGTSNIPAGPIDAQLGPPGSEVDKLVSRKTGVLGAFKTPPRGGAVIPPAFVQPKGAFAPPPVRRVTSESSDTSGAGAGARSVVARQVPPAPVRQAESEGAWAEVLYDYTSEDPADLAVEAGTRVLVTAKSSDDWWTGQVEGRGREGLFPAAYVKLL